MSVLIREAEEPPLSIAEDEEGGGESIIVVCTQYKKGGGVLKRSLAPETSLIKKCISWNTQVEELAFGDAPTYIGSFMDSSAGETDECTRQVDNVVERNLREDTDIEISPKSRAGAGWTISSEDAHLSAALALMNEPFHTTRPYFPQRIDTQMLGIFRYADVIVKRTATSALKALTILCRRFPVIGCPLIYDLSHLLGDLSPQQAFILIKLNRLLVTDSRIDWSGVNGCRARAPDHDAWSLGCANPDEDLEYFCFTPLTGLDQRVFGLSSAVVTRSESLNVYLEHLPVTVDQCLPDACWLPEPFFQQPAEVFFPSGTAADTISVGFENPPPICASTPQKENHSYDNEGGSDDSTTGHAHSDVGSTTSDDGDSLHANEEFELSKAMMIAWNRVMTAGKGCAVTTLLDLTGILQRLVEANTQCVLLRILFEEWSSTM